MNLFGNSRTLFSFEYSCYLVFDSEIKDAGLLVTFDHRSQPPDEIC